MLVYLLIDSVKTGMCEQQILKIYSDYFKTILQGFSPEKLRILLTKSVPEMNKTNLAMTYPQIN